MSERISKSSEEESKDNGLLSRFLNKDNFLKAVVFAGLAGILLIFLSSCFGGSSSDSEEPSSVDITVQTSEALEQYRLSLCEELGNMIAGIDGAGKTKIMLTMEQSVQNVYAYDNDIQQSQASQSDGEGESADSQSSQKNSYVIITQSDGTETALTITQIMPQVKGVLVICEGGEDEVVKNRIIEAVSAILDVSSSNICVTKLAS